MSQRQRPATRASKVSQRQEEGDLIAGGSRELSSRSSPTAERRRERLTAHSQGPYASASAGGSGHPSPSAAALSPPPVLPSVPDSSSGVKQEEGEGVTSGGGGGDEEAEEVSEETRNSKGADEEVPVADVTAAGDGEGDEDDGSGSGSSSTELSYELKIIQQPSFGIETGLQSNQTGILIRSQVIPPPVIQLVVQTREGENVRSRFDNLLCAATLLSEEGQSADVLERTSGNSSHTTNIVNLVGSTHHAFQILRRGPPDGNIFCAAFADIGVRLRGRYRLRFALLAAEDQSTEIAYIVSDIFEIYTPTDPRYDQQARAVIYTPFNTLLQSQRFFRIQVDEPDLLPEISSRAESSPNPQPSQTPSLGGGGSTGRSRASTPGPRGGATSGRSRARSRPSRS